MSSQVSFWHICEHIFKNSSLPTHKSILIKISFNNSYVHLHIFLFLSAALKLAILLLCTCQKTLLHPVISSSEEWQWSHNTFTNAQPGASSQPALGTASSFSSHYKRMCGFELRQEMGWRKREGGFVCVLKSFCISCGTEPLLNANTQ